MLEVRYEAVVADLEGETRRILAHCGLEWDARCLDFHRTQRPVRTASATQVRQPLYNSAVGRWRAYEPFLGPLLAELAPLIASDGLARD
jgi:DNA-binding IclR family transcriptional regulator